MITKKEIIKILFTLLLLVGTTAGIVLTQQRQNIKEKATTECNPGEICKHSCGYGEMPTGQLCSGVADGICCAPSCIPEGNICSSNPNNCCDNLVCKYTEDSGPDPICVKDSSPTPTPGGGDEGGGTQSGCSSASAKKCQGKNPGDSCGSGKKCVALNQTGNDGKPKCSCTTSSGDGDKGGNSCDKNPNPTVLDIKDNGEIVLSFASFLESTPPKIALKKNSQTCSLTEYDKLIDTKDTRENQIIATGIQVKTGDKLCIYGEDIGSDAGPYPFEGWIKPESNKCKEKDISSLIQTAQNSGGTVISQQCWGDYAKKADCDFDDYALIVATSGSLSPEKIKLLFRQQGITTKISPDIPSQLDTYITLTSGGNSYKIEKAVPFVDDNGVWIINFSTDDQGNNIPPGNYDLYIKGISHLRKKFANVQVDADNTTIDKSTDTKDELKAGDVNNDNIISIEDISLVLKYYTDFKVKVEASDKDMVGADVNKDGYITIDDVALVALNWSSFVVKGD